MNDPQWRPSAPRTEAEHIAKLMELISDAYPDSDALNAAQAATAITEAGWTRGETFVISEDIGWCEPDVHDVATTNSKVVAAIAANAGYIVTTQLPHFTTTNQFIQWAEANQ